MDAVKVLLYKIKARQSCRMTQEKQGIMLSIEETTARQRLSHYEPEAEKYRPLHSIDTALYKKSLE